MLTDQLWGGTLNTLSLDVPTQSLSLTIRVVRGDASHLHELQFVGLREFQFCNAIEGPWDYAEVTELHFEMDTSTGGWAFDLVLWSEDAGMSGNCRSATVDGVELTPNP